MNAVDLVKMQIKNAHNLLEGTVKEVSQEQLHWQPDGKAMCIAANFAHVVVIEDMFINVFLKNGKSLAHTDFAEKLGLNELPPTPDKQGFPDYSEWASQIKMDLATFQDYAKAVFSSTDEYIASLDEQKIFAEFEGPFGKSYPARFLSTLIIHASSHAGEISCIKGLQELKGYPI